MYLYSEEYNLFLTIFILREGGCFMMYLFEDNRRELLAKSKKSAKGRQRYDRRRKSRVANTVKSFNQIDMNKLFKENILTVNIPVHGETNDYKVRITFGGFLEILRDQIGDKDIVELKDISRACIVGFNKGDVYIFCSCEDFQYRFNYYATVNDINSGTPETRPSKITNPNDNLGSGCKHILLVLNNTSWVLRVARVINNYIKYMEKHYQKLYADIIYPAIFGKKYEEPVQLTLDDADELATDTDTLDTSNEYGKSRTQFQRGNTQGVRFAKEKQEDDSQMSLDIDED